MKHFNSFFLMVTKHKILATFEIKIASITPLSDRAALRRATVGSDVPDSHFSNVPPTESASVSK